MVQQLTKRLADQEDQLNCQKGIVVNLKHQSMSHENEIQQLNEKIANIENSHSLPVYTDPVGSQIWLATTEDYVIPIATKETPNWLEDDIMFPELGIASELYTEETIISPAQQNIAVYQLEHNYCSFNTETNKYLTYQTYDCSYKASPLDTPVLGSPAAKPHDTSFIQMPKDTKYLPTATLKTLWSQSTSVDNPQGTTSDWFTVTCEDKYVHSEEPIIVQAHSMKGKIEFKNQVKSQGNTRPLSKYATLPRNKSSSTGDAQIPTKPQKKTKYTAAPQVTKDTSPFRVKQCLLIHDRVIEDFNKEMFPTEFSVDTLKTKSVQSLQKDGRLETALKKCTYIHLGLDDIMNKRSEKMTYLLEETEANICYSTVIPT